MEQAFDLNIGEVLEHWTVPFAIREVIANALDEQTLTGTGEPVIRQDGAGRWHIADEGRGLRYEHLTQNENAEKLGHPDVIGQFGMGLKDALAVFDRRGVPITITSRHADVTTGRRAKQGFPDVITLHALVHPPSEPGRTGTEVVLSNVTDDDMLEAKRFFLRYSQEQVLEATQYGDVLAGPPRGQPARIYVKGMFVAEEPNFLFSYNIRKLSAGLRRALNRERSNVGRGAYTDRVKAILTACQSAGVAGALTADLAGYASGRLHDELAWRDVALHACRVLQTSQRVVFVTAWQMAANTPQLQYAREDGYRIVVVPEDIARALGKLTDLNGNPMTDLDAYRDAWNNSFSFTFVEPSAMSDAERARLRPDRGDRRPRRHVRPGRPDFRDHAAQRHRPPGARRLGAAAPPHRHPPRPAGRPADVRRHAPARDRPPPQPHRRRHARVRAAAHRAPGEDRRNGAGLGRCPHTGSRAKLIRPLRTSARNFAE